MRAARTPPAPAPTTNRSTSRSAMSRHGISDHWAGHRIVRFPAPRLDLVPPLLHFRPHLGDDLLRQLVSPGLGVFHALIEQVGLLRQELAAERRLVEGECVLELLLRE